MSDSTSFVLQPDDVVKEALIGQPKSPRIPNNTSGPELIEMDTAFNDQNSRPRARRGRRDTSGGPSNFRNTPAGAPGGNGSNGNGDNGSAGQNSSPVDDEMLKILRYLMWRQQLEDQHNKMVHEWRLLALAIDKILFWVFLVITVVSSLSFLVIIPIQRRGFGFGFG